MPLYVLAILLDEHGACRTGAKICADPDPAVKGDSELPSTLPLAPLHCAHQTWDGGLTALFAVCPFLLSREMAATDGDIIRSDAVYAICCMFYVA